MIPLLISPHDWQVLDANTAMFSTRYSLQPSCMGLYRRYSAVAGDGPGRRGSAPSPKAVRPSGSRRHDWMTRAAARWTVSPTRTIWTGGPS